MLLPELRSAEELAALVNELGFLPFFRNPIPGFSIEECTPPELYFVEGVDGPWEWKGPAIQISGGVYGKFFQNKAGFISREWFPDFANYRRDGYDFDARFDDGLAKYKDKQLLAALDETGPILSTGLKKAAGYGGSGGQKGFDTVITRLQMQCYIITEDFEYARDKHGKPYGWGVARYATPEQHYGSSIADEMYARTPQESYERLFAHLLRSLPGANAADIEKLLRGK